MSDQAELPGVTDKQAVWFSLYTDPSNPTTYLNATQSALVAYDTTSSNSARQIGHDNKRRLKPHFKKWLDEEGLSEEALKAKLIELMNAKKFHFSSHKGKIVETRVVEDNTTQKDMLKVALQVQGIMDPDVVSGDVHVYVTQYGEKKPDKLEDFLGD